jgi:acylphosphatase
VSGTTPQAIHVIVEGRVQGVGYRAFVEREAKKRGLTGWVRNRSDGTVEAVFAGLEEDLQSMISACHRGPRLSIVRNVRQEPHRQSEWKDFAVWPTV